MKRRAIAVSIACVVLTAEPARAHRIDEYLQATMLSLQPGTISLTIRLVPGIAVASSVIANIDRNADGTLSSAEQQAYAEHVVLDLLLQEDGHPLKLHVVNVSFPTVAQMQAGLGEMKLTLAADLPTSDGRHQLAFENHHEPGISVYLVNALVPEDTHLQIASQDRNRNQSTYQLSFTQEGSAPSKAGGFHLDGLAGAFQLGMRHIADGSDHLLFLLTLLLPAPLFAIGGRWRGSAGVRRSLFHILGIVTAFTIGHSSTLALSAFSLVQLPSRPVEVLIAVSIQVSAIHAVRPIFPGREAVIAGFFGLIHGLAFASALNELGMTGWYRLVSLFGFNLGIETMQTLVVLMTLPSLLLLSRTRWYTPFRMTGGYLSGCAAMVWMFERITDQTSRFDSVIEGFAKHGFVVAMIIFVCSSLAWLAGNPLSLTRPEESLTDDLSYVGRSDPEA